MTGGKSREDTVTQLQDRLQKLEAENRKWMRLAGIDRLTGLPNSLMLYQIVLPRELNKEKPLACILLCPDGLGEINQQHGRMVGDQLIQRIGHFLKQQKEPQEQLFHCDGANFAILIPEAMEGHAKRRATLIKSQFVRTTFSVEDKKFPDLTYSAGVAETGGLLARANRAAYVDRLRQDLCDRLDTAKKDGGNVVVGSSQQRQTSKVGIAQTPKDQGKRAERETLSEKGPEVSPAANGTLKKPSERGLGLSEEELLQICRRYEITCPICETQNEFFRLKPDICRPVETEGDGHPLCFKWSQPGFDAVDPKRFFWGVCIQCRFTGELEDAGYRQAAKFIAEYRRNFRDEALQQLLSAASSGEGIAPSLGERIRDDDPFGSILAKFHLGLFSQSLRLRTIPYHFARYYLRIAWLFRDQSTHYPEADLNAVGEAFAQLKERWEGELPAHKEYPVVPGMALNEAAALSFSQIYFERTYELLSEATQEDELKLMRLMAEIAYRRYELTAKEEDYQAASGYFSGTMQKIMSVVSDKSIDPGMANRIKQMLDAVGERGRALRELRQSKGGER